MAKMKRNGITPQRLKEIRLGLRLSVEHCAQSAGIGTATWWRWERSATLPVFKLRLMRDTIAREESNEIRRCRRIERGRARMRAT